MPTWGQVEKELLASRLGSGPPDFDGVRRRHLKRLVDHTGRPCIVYATSFDPPADSKPSDYSISLDPDVQAFMGAVHGLPRDDGLDLILHSSGGSAEAA